MTQGIEKPFTYEDYLALPDDGNRYEVIEGVLYVTPAPTPGHQNATLELTVALRQFVKDHNLGRVYVAPFELHLTELSRPVQPDICFISTDNLLPDDATYIVAIPELVVEVLSPSTSRTDMTIKFTLYERAGIKEYWIVDHKARSVRVFALVAGEYLLHGQYVEDEIITSRVLVGLEIINSDIFI